jgi:hypothetical protein
MGLASASASVAGQQGTKGDVFVRRLGHIRCGVKIVRDEAAAYRIEAQQSLTGQVLESP